MLLQWKTEIPVISNWINIVHTNVPAGFMIINQQA